MTPAPDELAPLDPDDPDESLPADEPVPLSVSPLLSVPSLSVSLSEETYVGEVRLDPLKDVDVDAGGSAQASGATLRRRAAAKSKGLGVICMLVTRAHDRAHLRDRASAQIGARAC